VIHLRAFARYRERLGFQTLDLALPTPPTLAGLLADPRLAGLPAEVLFAVNQAFAGPEAELKDGDEVALMPPVSGG
jgi:molybdopterin converting factor small subunit